MTTSSYSGQTAFGVTVDAPTLSESSTGDLAVARTAAAPSPISPISPISPTSPNLGPPPTSAALSPSGGRTTTLPRVEGDGESMRLVAEPRARYQPIDLLGTGGMGEVLLVQDNDIARKVAVKRLIAEPGSASALARFVDEVRTVGRLEHPSIVPIHDVGVDEEGRYYFVMKYVEGETLESILSKLAAGDPELHRRYTFERRAEIFMSLLHALAYAHAHGVVHRDIKPANVMVGRYGEVMLMDWGIAKPIDAKRDLAASAEGTLGEGGSGERGRMYATRVGTLVGTPAYMSPEQARGENDRIDARSDLYSAAVLFHELLTLRHYLEEKKNVDEMIDAVGERQVTWAELYDATSPVQPRPPRELLNCAANGLERDPARRYQSAGEMIDALQAILEGRMHVQCHVTMQKRMLREAGRFVDAHSHLAMIITMTVLAAVIFAVVQLARMVAA